MLVSAANLKMCGITALALKPAPFVPETAPTIRGSGYGLGHILGLCSTIGMISAQGVDV